MRHAEIAGAGFAGLAAATALCQRGWSVRVHEANPELRAFGAGIHVWANGLHVLAALDALDEIARGDICRPPAYENRTNEQRTSIETINAPGHDTLWTMTRQQVYIAMLHAAQRAGAEIITNSQAIAAEANGTLLLADGTRLPADLVIGADGVRSKVRDSFDLGQQRRRYTDGIIRVLVERGPLRGGAWDNVLDLWHVKDRTLRILYSPVSRDVLYLAMMSPATDTEASAVPVRPAVWLEAFPRLEPVLTRLGNRGRYDFYEYSKLERWSEGRVAIVGDSAHSMPPTLGQGASLAISNALGLAVALDEYDSVPQALRHWEARDRPLTDATQSRAGEIAGQRILAGGMDWDDQGLRAARSIPTGTMAMALS